MAGIGFELRRLVDRGEGLLSKARGYAVAGLISAGPWIMTVVTIGTLDIVARQVIDVKAYELFRGLVTYAFAFSLVVVGVLQMSATRHVADLLFAREHERVLPAFNACAAVVGALQTAIGAVFCIAAELPALTSVVAVTLYVVVSLTWLALIWLGVTKEYDAILRAYVVGAVVSIVGVMSLASNASAAPVLAGYTAGQAVTLAMLMRVLARGMASGGGRDWSALGSVRRFPMLVVVGVAYNAGIWIDKMVFWFIDGVGPHPLIRFHPLYDACSFLAYITVVPALAVNLVRVETSFYELYREYYGAVLDGLPLEMIERCRVRMIENLRAAAARLLRVQGLITILVIVFAGPIITALGLPPAGVPVFRAACLGAFFHVMLLVTLLLLLYFDLRRQAMEVASIFVVLNLLLAVVSVHMGISTYGIGYALAALVALFVGAWRLSGCLDRLEYHTFTRQPLHAGADEAPDEPPDEPADEPEATDEAAAADPVPELVA